MAAASYSFTIEQGTTHDEQFVWRDAPADEGGVPIDLTGYTARMHIRLQKSDPDPTLDTLTTGNSRITLGGVAGTVTIHFSDTITAAYTWTSALYDLELVSASGVVTRLVQGRITVDPEVTR